MFYLYFDFVHTFCLSLNLSCLLFCHDGHDESEEMVIRPLTERRSYENVFDIFAIFCFSKTILTFCIMTDNQNNLSNAMIRIHQIVAEFMLIADPGGNRHVA